MKLNVYSIFDVKTGAYMRPFFLQSDGQAMRMFGDLAIDADHDVGRHPEDYTLVRIGAFNDQKGALVPEMVESLVTGLECVAQSQKIAPGSLRENGELLDEIGNGTSVQSGAAGEHTAE